ncbi:ATP-binding protein [Pseudoruegeria sp. SHC-113]|uniref:ATP-binding protein n=1 Tax=Pseudoruegeria sp. SHC-113 TaxID=2855439 RepID=UPI0021BAC4CD|nr:ATP-binding protein [Pseudoruegeria sp. SHC-113]MCT8159279.1 ATP-binding protein [Pseudoruegeria sp. SHC-113]
MLEISKSDVLRSFRRDNPWWDEAFSAPKDPREKKRAYFEPFAGLALDWSVRRSTILMGPRRVGKTVMLRQLIEQAISDGFSGKNILFVSIDTPLYSGMPLLRLIELFEEETAHNPSERRIIVFDEIQYLKNWEVHLKVLTDQYPNTRFIASGSAAAALRLKSEESGAGRFTDFFLPPLTFAEFLAFSEIEDDLITSAALGSTLRFATPDIAKLNQEFINYLNFGGYPEAVLNETIKANVQRFLGRDIIDKVLLRDLPSLYGIQDIQELNRLFTTLAYHTGQEISLDGLAQSSGVAKNTITKYLDYLEAAFLIVRVRRVDDTGKTFKRMRNFKVYLTNPSMRAALFSQISDGDEAMGAMAETAIFSQWFHSDTMKNLHYARWKKGKKDLEVDIVRVDPARLKSTWAYEIKWSDRYALDQPGELSGLVEFAKRNFEKGFPAGATSKTVYAESEVDGVLVRHFPCSLHCYQVGKNVAEGRAP